MNSHPFDRYSSFTDLESLKRASSEPLRKSIRVNTLKCSLEDFHAWAKERGWRLTPVPWCPEGFFVERENRETALGRDLRHLLGHFYMQEASSMLPVALLDPKPGEEVLDLCAAPGSKTTQIAARMEGRGVVIANDMQEKRLRILYDAIERTGASNVVILKKAGQWYAKHMTERFDRVLCDAPCTAQGTIRKDPTALSYSSEFSVIKAARLQRELLEAAVHATKIGGRIVYSTCTLTPEENEEVIREILNKFVDQLEIVNPREIFSEEWGIEKAIEDSSRVQGEGSVPMLRLWPQTYNTEGFFCAVLRKVKRTKEIERMEWRRHGAGEITKAKRESLQALFQSQFGTDFLMEGDSLVEKGQHILLVRKEAYFFPLPTEEYALGVPFAKNLGDERYRVTNDLASLRGNSAKERVMELDSEQLNALLTGKDIPCAKTLKGDTVLRFHGVSVGLGLAKEGLLLNRLPRWVVKLGTPEKKILPEE